MLEKLHHENFKLYQSKLGQKIMTLKEDTDDEDEAEPTSIMPDYWFKGQILEELV